MSDPLKTSVTATASTSVDKPVGEKDINNTSYWKQILKSYEKRNASLERRRNALVERIRFMECTLPSLLVGAVASSACSKREIPDECPRTLEETPPTTAHRR